MWNERFAQPGYAYGREPNEFLKNRLSSFTPGKILFAAEGEGRNAVYAASKGWKVSAFDISNEGRKKALQLAEEQGVQIDYKTGELDALGYKAGEFDGLVLIYAHFNSALRATLHTALGKMVRKGGFVLLEGFSRKHTENQARNEHAGGPKDINMMFAPQEIKKDFKEFDIEQLEETTVVLNEGQYHNGLASVVRFIGFRRD